MLLGESVLQILPAFRDSVDESVAPANNAKCGTKEFSILLSEGGPVPPYLTLTGTTLSLETGDA